MAADSSVEPSIGIDLGTTNSAVATMVDGKARIIERRTGQRLLPSMVGFTPGGDRVVGEPARFLAETFPEDVAYATKRFMGLRWTQELAQKAREILPFPIVAGPSDDIRVKIAGRTLPVVQVAAMVLSELRLDAEAFYGREVKKAVITVPANFNDAQRQATKEAAQIAGLEVMRLINEPTAAALAYGLTTGFEGRALVFDLGGGTFDISVLEVRDGVFEVVATGGDTFLGGEDFDNVIVQWLIAQVPDSQTRERVSHDRVALQRLKSVSEQAKIAVSTTDQARVSTVLLTDVKGSGYALETMLTRDFFEKISEPKIKQCIDLVDKTLSEAKLTVDDISQVLLVGGMTRMPLLRAKVAEHLKKEPAAGVNPDEVVSLGAAVHAAELISRVGKVLLMDVVSATLGVGVAGGLFKPLIKKHTPLPCKANDVFYPSKDGQTRARIPVLQGESARAAENFLLGELTLGELKTVRRSDNAIEVQFEMGTDGILAVEAKDVSTGKAETARIVARTDLPASELNRMAQKEQAHRETAEAVHDGVRHRNVELRSQLQEAIDKVRALHQELTLAAQETGASEAKDVVESLGRRIVDAETVARSGTVLDVEATTLELRKVLESLGGGQKKAS